MRSYILCVRTEHEAAGDDGPALQRSLLAARNNAAVAELEAVRELYEAHRGPIADLVFDVPFDADDTQPAPRARRPAPDRAARRRLERERDEDQCITAICDTTFPDAGH